MGRGVAGAAPRPAPCGGHPDTVTLTVKPPDDDSVAYTWADEEVAKWSLGVFYYDLPLAVAGRHILHWAGTGAAAVTIEKEITVSVSRI